MVNSENRVLLSIVVPLYNQLLDHVEAKLAIMDSQDDRFDAIEACHDKLEKIITYRVRSARRLRYLIRASNQARMKMTEIPAAYRKAPGSRTTNVPK